LVPSNDCHHYVFKSATINLKYIYLTFMTRLKKCYLHCLRSWQCV